MNETPDQDPMRELTTAVRELTTVMTDWRQREDAARAVHGGLSEPHEVIGEPEAEPAPVAPVGIGDLIRYWRDEAALIESDDRYQEGNGQSAEYLRMCAEMAEAVLAGRPGAYSCTECGHIDQPEYWHWTDDHDKVTAPGDPDSTEADYEIDVKNQEAGP